MKVVMVVQQQFAQAVSLHQQGQLAQAQALYEQVLAAQPAHFDALHLLGIIALQTRNLPRAVELIGRAIGVNPNDAAAHYNVGRALQDLNQFDAARQSFERAIALRPDFAEAYNNHGIVLLNLKQPAAAVYSFDRAIALRPDFADAYYCRGNALKQLKRYEAAIHDYDRVIALSPGFAETYYNRGVTLQDLGRLEEAVQSYDRAIALDPGLAEAYTNRGMVLSDLKRPREAIQSYERIVALRPDFAEANFSLGLCHLQMGNFEEGWKKFEWRWKAEGLNLDFVQPQWSGAESLHGKTILLYGEHGLGDTIHFCRYAKQVADLGAHVILQVQRPLIGLLGALAGVEQVFARGDALPAFDYHCPLMSLPPAFKTDLSNLPSAGAYLASDADKVEKWRARLGAGNRPRVGLVWSGYKGHKNDRNRSIPLHDFVKALPKDIQFICLQKELREADREALASRPDILFFGGEINDFTDTAALCELVDVIVSVDTSVAHLAGALGRPVWILLPFNPDWRWLLERDDSPWYPSAKLYRQERRGNWGGVIDKVNSDLSQLPGPRPESII